MDALNILERLCLQPAVSYHEYQILREITGILKTERIHMQQDRWGNLVAQIPGDETLPPLVFVAHMDHPGFEAIETIEVNNGKEAIVAEPRGGFGIRAYDVGTSVRVVARNGITIYGHIDSHGSLRKSGRFAKTDRVIIRPDPNASMSKVSQMPYPAAVILDLPSYSLDGDMIRARQLDDLAGCATILTALTTISSDRSNQRPVIGLFTRAEEVGLVGASLAAGDNSIHKDAIIVSVETSLKSDIAKQGQGIIIRVGDRLTTFDHEAETLLHLAANRIQERVGEDDFKVQRALMGAGGCEASAFKAHGYKVTGTSYPLGAWHNTEDDGSIIPEYIHINDFRSGIALITEAMRDDSRHQQNDALRYLAAFPETGAMRLRETLN